MMRCGLIVCATVAAVGGVAAQPPASPAVRPAANEPRASQQSATLGQVISLRLDHVTLESALQTIAARARVRISYSRADVPLDKAVSLVVDSITVGDALTLLLRGTGVSVLEAPGGLIALGRGGATTGAPVASTHQVAAGTISGSVTDSLTHAPVPYVLVKIDDAGQSVRSGVDGKYTLLDIPAGDYHVTARRVGFIAKTKTVTVEERKVATLNFTLNQPPTKLDEVVTTALGEQRRYEVGNSIATINVDSLVPTTPVTSITDILTSRVPGLQVVETGGLVGSGEAIRIRGQSSLVLAGDPIIFVDGVRADNTAGGESGGLFSAIPSPSRINDIDFSQVETLTILRGPAATTEYGSDAANGVIVITTKRGTSGRPQWSAGAERTTSDVPEHFPEYYYAWGHLTDGTRAPVNCPLVPLEGGTQAQYGPPFNTAVTLGTCVQDSVTHFNPLNDPTTTMFGNGTRTAEHVSVSGGSESMRYTVGGRIANDIGAIRLPDVFRSQAQAVGFPSSVFNPNSQNQRSVNARTDIRLASTADLAVSSAYMSTYQSTPGGSWLATPSGDAPVLNDSAHYYGYGQQPGPSAGYQTPLTQLGRQANQQTDRLQAGMTVNWRPLSWLSASGAVGIDHGSQSANQQILPEVSIYAQGRDSAGSIYVGQRTTNVYSANVRASAVAAITRWVHLTTSIGFDFADTRSSGVAAYDGGIASNSFTLNNAQNATVIQSSDRSASLGGYVDETVGLPGGIFLNAAMRTDAGSGYGHGFRVSLDPKTSVSFVALKGPETTLRLRAALGLAGQQPPNGASLLLYNLAGSGYLNGGPVSTAGLAAVGNPQLQPERSEEIEGGVDLGLFESRVSLEATAYQKATHHALINTNLGFDLGNSPYTENLGEVRNTGVEVAASALVLQSWPLTWSVSVNGALNHNKLLKLDPNVQQIELGTAERFVVGYPLYGYWGRRMHYADLNRDGIIDANEVTFDTAYTYMGSELPTQTASASTHIGFFGSAITIGALADYGGGYRLLNVTGERASSGLYLQEQNQPGSPLFLQARAVMASYAANGSGWFEDGTYIRFRELSVTYTVPARWAKRARLRTLSVTGAVRNLALWTRFSGPDPEVANFGGGGTGNDVRLSGGDAVPLTRQWFVRFNLGL